MHHPEVFHLFSLRTVTRTRDNKEVGMNAVRSRPTVCDKTMETHAPAWDFEVVRRYYFVLLDYKMTEG